MSEISELLKQIKNLHIQTKDLVESIESGTYNSKFRGGGIEFSEVREYMPGDDVKRIDWNVSARHNNLFVKEFVEENELNVYLILESFICIKPIVFLIIISGSFLLFF